MPTELAPRNSIHALTMMLASRDARIKELELEVARLTAGARPASAVRDLVLTALMGISKDLKAHVFESEVTLSIRDLDKLILVLAENIPGAVEHRPNAGKMADKNLKEYKPLDNGPRDPAAADPKYAGPPDLKANTL